MRPFAFKSFRSTKRSLMALVGAAELGVVVMADGDITGRVEGGVMAEEEGWPD